MGGEQSRGKTIDDFLLEYEEVRTEYDNRMGEVKIYRKITNPEIQVLSKEKCFQRKQEFELFMKKVEKRKKLNNENIAPLLLTISNIFLFSFLIKLDDIKKEWCSEFFKVFLIYEYQERTLEQVLRHRRSYNDIDMMVRINKVNFNHLLEI